MRLGKRSHPGPGRSSFLPAGSSWVQKEPAAVFHAAGHIEQVLLGDIADVFGRVGKHIIVIAAGDPAQHIEDVGMVAQRTAAAARVAGPQRHPPAIGFSRHACQGNAHTGERVMLVALKDTSSPIAPLCASSSARRAVGL